MFEEVDDEITETDSLTTEINITEEPQNLTSPTKAIIETPIEISPTESSGVFTAVPVSLEDLDESLHDDQIDTTSSMDTSVASAIESTRPTGLDISSDSDYSIERTYNVVTGEVSKKGAEVVEDAKSPVGIKYIQNGFDEDESMKNEFLRKWSAIKTLTCDEVASSQEQIKEVKEMLQQEESTVPYEENNNNIEDVNKENIAEADSDGITPDSLISTEETDNKDFSLVYSISDHGDNLVDQPEMSEEALLQSTCQSAPKKEQVVNTNPPEFIRIDTNIPQAGDTNDEMIEITIPSVKNLRKLFDSSITNTPNVIKVTKRMSATELTEMKSEILATEEPAQDIIIIENGETDEELVQEEEKPIFQSVKNLRKLFDKDNQQNMVNNSITARSISKQVQIQLKQDNTQY